MSVSMQSSTNKKLLNKEEDGRVNFTNVKTHAYSMLRCNAMFILESVGRVIKVGSTVIDKKYALPFLHELHFTRKLIHGVKRHKFFFPVRK